MLARGGILRNETSHAIRVDAWLGRTAKNRSSATLLRLLEAALEALWKQTNQTLGEVTMTAIAERVVYSAARKFPMFSVLTIDQSTGIQCAELRPGVNELDKDTDLLDGARFMLVEFLTVLGNLTAELLTPELHRALSKVALPKRKAEKKRK